MQRRPGRLRQPWPAEPALATRSVRPSRLPRYGASAFARGSWRDHIRRRVSILDLSVSTFTLVHVVLSLIGILSGFIVVLGMLGSKKLTPWTALFLATTALTSATGFFFPRDHFLPTHVIGILSLIALAVAIVAFSVFHLAGGMALALRVAATIAL